MVRDEIDKIISCACDDTADGKEPSPRYYTRQILSIKVGGVVEVLCDDFLGTDFDCDKFECGFYNQIDAVCIHGGKITRPKILKDLLDENK